MNPKQLDQLIAELGLLILTNPATVFDATATEKCQDIQIDATGLAHLQHRLHNPPDHLPGTPIERLGLGQWMVVCQFVIFEILYQSGTQHLAFIKEIAFGIYDWTQATALETLCRLVLTGQLPEGILDEINQGLGEMRYETHIYFGKALHQRGRKDPAYQDLMKRFDNPEFQDSLADLQE